MGGKLPKMKKNQPSLDGSSFEKLPLELTYEIIELVPESALNLRLTCRAVKACVDSHSMRRPNVSILHELRVFSYSEQATTPGRMIVSMIVSKEDSNLFKMRIIRNPPGNIARILKTEGTLNAFNFDCLASEESMLKYLRECFGKKIENVEIVGCRDQQTTVAVCKLLKKIQIKKLKVSNSNGDKLCQKLKADRVQHR